MATKKPAKVPVTKPAKSRAAAKGMGDKAYSIGERMYPISAAVRGTKGKAFHSMVDRQNKEFMRAAPPKKAAARRSGGGSKSQMK